ncbi:MAG: protein translocase subunit SecF [Candidatus Coatesbacteria bacterium]|nr:protein translocase subunit SecF [Candidatus Coatesbacteria bacterium]
MDFLKNTHYQFIERRKTAFICSAIVILAGLLSLIIRGGPNYGIDFEGGTLIQLKFLEPVEVSSMRDILKSIDYGDAIIQRFGTEKEVLIRVKEAESASAPGKGVADQILSAIHASVGDPEAGGGKLDINAAGPAELALNLKTLEAFKDNAEAANSLGLAIVEARNKAEGQFASLDELSAISGMPPEAVKYFKNNAYISKFIVTRQEMVGPKVGKDLRGKAVLAIFWAVLGILVYISLRFRFRFAVAAIVALIHDVAITLGIFSIFDREISLTIIAALLTIVGYSLNDTIVVFDRIRENSKALRSLPLIEQLDVSINQTLARTILTSLTTFIVVFVLFVMGGEVIRDFALALIIGIVVGTYSSIFVASPILYEWERLSIGRSKKKHVSSGSSAA